MAFLTKVEGLMPHGRGFPRSKLMEEPDVQHTFTEEEVQELANWIESLTLVDIAALKAYWEKRQECETQLQ